MAVSIYFHLKYMSPLWNYFESKANVEHNEDIAGERQARNFVNACLGIEEIVVKPEEARNVNALIEAIYRSDLDNKSIQL